MLARLMHQLLSQDAEAGGLLALIFLTDARRATRTSATGELVLLRDQDRSRWDRRMIDEGRNICCRPWPSIRRTGTPFRPRSPRLTLMALRSVWARDRKQVC